VREGACIGAATILQPVGVTIVCVCLLLQDLVQSCLHGGGGIWEDMCYERRRADGTLEEPGTLIQGAPVFPGSSRLGIEPKTPGWLVQAQPPAHRGI
jgi:hypothetical protein